MPRSFFGKPKPSPASTPLDRLHQQLIARRARLRRLPAPHQMADGASPDRRRTRIYRIWQEMSGEVD